MSEAVSEKMSGREALEARLGFSGLGFESALGLVGLMG